MGKRTHKNGRNNKRRNNKNSEGNNNNTKPKFGNGNMKNKNLWDIIKNIIITAVCIPFIGVMATAYVDLRVHLNEFEYIKQDLNSKAYSDELENLIDSVKELKNSVESSENKRIEMNTKLDIMNGQLDDMLGLYRELILGKIQVATYMPTSYITDSLSTISAKEGRYVFASPNWNETDIIAINCETGEECSAEQLYGKTLLMPYKEGNNDVIFLGQYNENNQWDGQCILNVYSDNALILIMEATYEDGNLLKYRNIFFDEDYDGKKWIYEKRICDSEKNTGENYIYVYEKSINKQFEIENVTYDNILYIADFFDNQKDLRLESYYCGSVKDGYYNDITGNAYYVKYDENGTVKTLYVGNFKEGNFHDTTGKAWYIVKSEKKVYMYYKGEFRNGKPIHNEGFIFVNNLTMDDIEKYIAGYDFKCSVSWDGM